MLTLLIGIIVLVGAGYLGFVFYQRRTIKMATDVYENKRDLNKIPLDDEFALAKKMNLTGESHKKYDQLYNKYQHYKNQMLPNIDEGIAAVKEDGKGINFLKTKSDWQSANQAIADADATLKEIQAGLAQLYDLNKQHKLALEELEKKYKRLREDILNKNESFGPSIDSLEKMLSDIEGTFDEFTQLTKSGDPNSAEEVLSDLNNSTDKLESYMGRIPKLYQLLSKEFVEQVDEITSGYKELKGKQYNFPNDKFDETLKGISDQIKVNTNKLKTLEVDSVEKATQDIADRIDKLYDAIEKEFQARPKVEKNTKIIGQYIEHVRKQNSDLQLRLETLNKSYILNHQEIENNHQFDQQIATIEKKYQDEVNAMQNGTAVYSTIDADQTHMIKELGQIESEQKDLFSATVKLPEQEQAARNALAKFDLAMRNTKRRIDNHNLPGLSNDYQDAFTAVIREINHLDDAMNQPQIDVDDISKQLTIIQSDMDTLDEKTNQLIDDATLAEQTMQYANRFIGSNSEIAAASKTAQMYFDQKYDYEQSLNIISKALEKQSSGMFAKIKDDYFNAKKHLKTEKTDEDES
ncbi:septation ring formation regulator EzrA [Lentilactobacillus buchneri]|uniref:Septation ring formation regulator EzrA n=1 Tax=Lentilactobacillus buchneri subsp. silagei CD034 TaxID=1071400 RepID=J9W769_LENBU|nr:septation ring formation regulator EzrA [Lentilactobacillus buchneri]MCC6100467.1 septation ring formation regulator EzrA [Lactobacillus sp.]AFS00071.1 septation ring formation regulator ezrA [Lentilactobacillus buchneri subsp. silagei CD034]MCT2900550.1 septation ring formation regulator EzrA [Lentilactobacillus buchneri]MCT3541537.1 septation ring formation regulator EzrA [Lentilactobacillus buchneri]MCT3544813.1 septation ring formation regulator EzrA [Lentilactobacillus buchneri]